MRRVLALLLLCGLAGQYGCVTILGGAAASAVGGVATSYWVSSHHEKFYHKPFKQVWQAAMAALKEGNYLIVEKKNGQPEEELEVISRDRSVTATITFHRVNPSVTRLKIYATDSYNMPDRIQGAALLASIDAKLGKQ